MLSGEQAARDGGGLLSSGRSRDVGSHAAAIRCLADARSSGSSGRWAWGGMGWLQQGAWAAELLSGASDCNWGTGGRVGASDVA